MMESDWKIFKRIKEKAIEQFCTLALSEFGQVINDDRQSAHNRYLLLFKLVQAKDEQMQLLFDDHSRSSAPMQLIAIRRQGLADKELLSRLSVGLLDSTDPKLHEC